MKLTGRTLLMAALTGVLLSGSLLAATPAPVKIADVALGEGGMLIGQVVDTDGTAVANMNVSLHINRKEVAKNTTDKRGMFAFRGLQGGTCQLVTTQESPQTAKTAEHGVACRVWAPGTAPPKAQAGILLVTDGEVVRGDWHTAKHWLTNPWVVGGIVATAVAVPVIVHNTKDDSSP